jgi:spectinomycin phosphotransferase
VRTPPTDLPVSALRHAVEAGWSLQAATLEYRPVGFGSHHWELTDTSGDRRFVTVDDVRTRGFDSVRAPLAAAQALRATGRDFVVAPLPSRDGAPVIRLGDAYALAVYPFVAGESFDWATVTPEHHRAVLDLIAAVHTAPPEVRDLAPPDEYAIPLRAMFDGVVDPDLGPYARPASDLLTRQSAGLRRALARYDDRVVEARADRSRLVLTHGEPGPHNTMRADGRWLLVDWESALVAPPERDLWELDETGAYTAATGIVPRPHLLELYRMHWHLTEVAVCLARFRGPHGNTADDAETWENLREAVTTVVG